MLPTFDPDELAPYTDLPQRHYAKRRRGDLRDRFRCWWLLMHNGMFGGPYPWTERNKFWREWDQAKARHVIPRGRWSSSYKYVATQLNRRVRRRVRTALRLGIEFDPREYEEKMPWMD